MRAGYADALTEYGFRWGPIEVQRACSDGRYHTLIIQSKDWQLEVSVSPTGKAMHVNKQHRRKS
jgi:hypothetical protein